MYQYNTEICHNNLCVFLPLSFFASDRSCLNLALPSCQSPIRGVFNLASSWPHLRINKIYMYILSKSKKQPLQAPLVHQEEEKKKKVLQFLNKACCDALVWTAFSLQEQKKKTAFFFPADGIYSRPPLANRVPSNADRSSAQGAGVREMSLQAPIESYQRLAPPTVRSQCDRRHPTLMNLTVITKRLTYRRFLSVILRGPRDALNIDAHH